MKSDKCFAKINGRLKVIVNWRSRQSDSDIVIAEDLNTTEIDLYHKLKESGKEDEHIFNELFPKCDIKILQSPMEIDKLTREQLIDYIRSKIDLSITSLELMLTEDLKKLCIKL